MYEKRGEQGIQINALRAAREWGSILSPKGGQEMKIVSEIKFGWSEHIWER